MANVYLTYIMTSMRSQMLNIQMENNAVVNNSMNYNFCQD